MLCWSSKTNDMLVSQKTEVGGQVGLTKEKSKLVSQEQTLCWSYKKNVCVGSYKSQWYVGLMKKTNGKLVDELVY